MENVSTRSGADIWKGEEASSMTTIDLAEMLQCGALIGSDGQSLISHSQQLQVHREVNLQAWQPQPKADQS
ncbi:hypothetical protein D3C85_1828350 [compost metagenome]